MPLPLKDRVKVNQIVEKILNGKFDANDVDNLLMKLRPYSIKKPIFNEVAHYVAHSDARNKGLTHTSINSFSDFIKYLNEYPGKKSLDISHPFPAYVFRFLLSQGELCDESQLKLRFKMSRQTLNKKIRDHFSVSKDNLTCTKSKNPGSELLEAISWITGSVQIREAFHMMDFHKDLKDLLTSEKINFDRLKWERQENRITLAVLCLISNTKYILQDKSEATCVLTTADDTNSTIGPDGKFYFGKLIIQGIVQIVEESKGTAAFTLIETGIDAIDHCHKSLLKFRNHGEISFPFLDLSPDMSLTEEYLLIRSDAFIADR